MIKGLNIICVLVLTLVISACRSPQGVSKGPLRRAVELPVVATDEGLDKSYSVIKKRIHLPGGNKAPILERQLPIYYEGGSNIAALQRD